MQIYAMIRFGVTPEINAMATIVMVLSFVLVLHRPAPEPRALSSGMNRIAIRRETWQSHTAKKAAKKPQPRRKKAPKKAAKKPRKAGSKAKKVIALFPEAAFGPALNSVGIGQALKKLGHKVVFLSDPGFLDIYKGYGFEAYPVNLSEPLPPEQMAKFWVDFINGHIPNFRKTPYEQIDNYVKDCWSMIVETAKWAEKDLPGVLDMVKPDVICVDNVILFPGDQALCEAEQEALGAHHLVLGERDRGSRHSAASLRCGCEGQEGPCAYRKHFNEVIKPIHDEFNAFLKSVGEKKYPLGPVLRGEPAHEHPALSFVR
jgi:hypothetical protein